MNSDVFKAVLKAHWRAAIRAKNHSRYDSSNEQYWKGRQQVTEDIYFDLFEQDIKTLQDNQAED